MIIKNAKVFHAEGYFEKKDLFIKGDTIVSPDENNDMDEIIDGEGLFAIPGLTDIHFHGCMGVDFCNGTKEAIQTMADYEASHGITTICPATMTLGEEKLAEICTAAKDYDSPKGAILCGLNMEGPFISREKKGAQNEEFIHVPDVSMFCRLQEKSGNMIKLVAIAPEAEGAMSFIEEMKGETVLSLAHTAADYDTALEALEKGASHVTHLYNAMLPFNHRAPGVVGAAFDAKGCKVELICDGIHIHPSMVRATFDLFGEDRIILISDSMEATGMPDGVYSLGGQKVIKKGNYATLENGTLAGSAANLMDCVRAVVHTMSIPLESAVKCAAVNPAKEIGIYDKYGSLDEGKIANVVLLDEKLDIKKVLLKGKEV